MYLLAISGKSVGDKCASCFCATTCSVGGTGTGNFSRRRELVKNSSIISCSPFRMLVSGLQGMGSNIQRNLELTIHSSSRKNLIDVGADELDNLLHISDNWELRLCNNPLKLLLIRISWLY